MSSLGIVKVAHYACLTAMGNQQIEVKETRITIFKITTKPLLLLL